MATADDSRLVADNGLPRLGAADSFSGRRFPVGGTIYSTHQRVCHQNESIPVDRNSPRPSLLLDDSKQPLSSIDRQPSAVHKVEYIAHITAGYSHHLVIQMRPIYY